MPDGNLLEEKAQQVVREDRAVVSSIKDFVFAVDPVDPDEHIDRNDKSEKRLSPSLGVPGANRGHRWIRLGEKVFLGPTRTISKIIFRATLENFPTRISPVPVVRFH